MAGWYSTAASEAFTNWGLSRALVLSTSAPPNGCLTTWTFRKSWAPLLYSASALQAVETLDWVLKNPKLVGGSFQPGVRLRFAGAVSEGGRYIQPGYCPGPDYESTAE